jgi:thiol-disulfide isomerase/thioredoxin
VQLEGGLVVRAWSDANLNGDLLDDPAPPLSAFPGRRPARSFRTTLRWETEVEGRRLTIERLIRVVVEAPDSAGAEPAYRIQDVHGMLGTLEIDGVPRAALLYDANHDGLYTRGRGDGVFVDLDGDRHFTIDPMTSDFGPFAIPFTIHGTSFVVDSVALDGSRLTWREMGPALAESVPLLEGPAPDFTYVDVEGRFVRLSALRGKIAVLYFWASWCGSCRRQAEELHTLYARSHRSEWDLIGICYDTDREAAMRFRAEHDFTWPTSFSGGLPSQDPVGRLYREDGAGVFYVIGPDGRLVTKVFAVGELETAVNTLRAGATGK